MKLSRVLTIWLVLGLACAAQRSPESESARRPVLRLRPIAFANLPKDIVRELNRRKCRIPQSAYNNTPHNAIKGEFARPGQTDWAVLCSIGGISSILVFWSGAPDHPYSLAFRRDEDFFQDMGGGKFGFSRGISAVGKDFIVVHNSTVGRALPRRIDHQGIDDAFIEKGSSVHYYDGRKWLKLAGAD